MAWQIFNMYYPIVYVLYNYFIQSGKSPGAARRYSICILVLQFSLNLLAAFSIFMKFTHKNIYMALGEYILVIIALIICMGIITFNYFSKDKVTVEREKEVYSNTMQHKIPIIIMILTPLIVITVLNIVFI
jgi:hypothetical protein